MLLACMAATGSLLAQSAKDLNEGLKMEYDSANAIWRLKWWGKTGRTYFLQHSDDLTGKWIWIDALEQGENAVKQYGISSNGTRLFLRLRHTDQPAGNPETADFDADGVGNRAELQQGTDPFSAADTDGDGLPDDWEIRYFGSLAQSGSADPDGDGLTNLQEWQAATDPTKKDTDGDGVADGTVRLNFQYDLVGRLGGAQTGAGGSEVFSYDNSGNVQTTTGTGNP